MGVELLKEGLNSGYVDHFELIFDFNFSIFIVEISKLETAIEARQAKMDLL